MTTDHTQLRAVLTASLAEAPLVGGRGGVERIVIACTDVIVQRLLPWLAPILPDDTARTLSLLAHQWRAEHSRHDPDAVNAMNTALAGAVPTGELSTDLDRMLYLTVHQIAQLLAYSEGCAVDPGNARVFRLPRLGMILIDVVCLIHLIAQTPAAWQLARDYLLAALHPGPPAERPHILTVHRYTDPAHAAETMHITHHPDCGNDPGHITSYGSQLPRLFRHPNDDTPPGDARTLLQPGHHLINAQHGHLELVHHDGRPR
jgi:hypothetical protein